jgi:NAD(P)-dependent dehydrogenase (short-subunit alcohol dehydrogenase family)
MKLKDKIVVITGAKGGLGNFATNAFLEAGARVVGVSRSITDADFPHPGFSAVQMELSGSSAARELIDGVVAKLGKIDALVHLVGGFAGGQTVDATDDATLDRMLDINLKSAFYLLQAVVPHMRAQGGGHILAIGSRLAVEPQPNVGSYAVSKAALVALIRTVALENKDKNVSANIILPSTMDTPVNRSAMPKADYSKWVQPGEVANLLVHLAASQAGQINGAVIPVYGGEL